MVDKVALRREDVWSKDHPQRFICFWPEYEKGERSPCDSSYVYYNERFTDPETLGQRDSKNNIIEYLDISNSNADGGGDFYHSHGYLGYGGVSKLNLSYLVS